MSDPFSKTQWEAGKIFASEVLRLEEGGLMVCAELSPSEAAAVVVLLQLALRHPGCLGATRDTGERVGRLLQQVLARHSPEVDRQLEQGWHPVFDVPRSTPP